MLSRIHVMCRPQLLVSGDHWLSPSLGFGWFCMFCANFIVICCSFGARRSANDNCHIPQTFPPKEQWSCSTWSRHVIPEESFRNIIKYIAVFWNSGLWSCTSLTDIQSHWLLIESYRQITSQSKAAHLIMHITQATLLHWRIKLFREVFPSFRPRSFSRSFDMDV